jgi:hypothetical protein
LNPVDSTFVIVAAGDTTVITVEFAFEVVRPEAVSVATIVAVAPTVAPAATVASPAVFTETTPGDIDVKLSPDAASGAWLPLL